jgi:glycerol-3-phosphate acyltransferase PlsX
VDCRPVQLLGYGIIGDVFATQYLGIENPRVALLSVGAEAGKGNRQVRETTELLAKSSLNFIGNVEAHDLPQNKADVVLCDGFVGNVVMKLSEGLGQATVDYLRGRLDGKLSSSDLDELLKDVYALNNPVEVNGGGPLFGVNGVSVIGHGRAKAEAVKSAIGTAKMVAESGFIAELNKRLAEFDAMKENE